MSDTGARTRKLYGFFSEFAVRNGIGSSWYKTPDGGRVEVTAIDEDPEGKSYLWSDKRLVGEVTEFDGFCRPKEGLVFLRLGNRP